MLRTVPRYGFVARIAARQQWVYRGELWMRSIAMVLFMGVFMALWSTAFRVSGQSELAGYSLVEIVWYLAMTETITLSTSRAFVDISDAVKSGDLAYTLTRPVSYPFFQVAQSLGSSLPRLGLNLLTASAVVALGVGLGAGLLDRAIAKPGDAVAERDAHVWSISGGHFPRSGAGAAVHVDPGGVRRFGSGAVARRVRLGAVGGTVPGHGGAVARRARCLRVRIASLRIRQSRYHTRVRMVWACF